MIKLKWIIKIDDNVGLKGTDQIEQGKEKKEANEDEGNEPTCSNKIWRNKLLWIIWIK